MKKFIYISSIPAAPTTTKRQQILFASEVAFAVSSGYDYIKSSDNMTFKILDDNELVEVDVTEEQLQAEYLNKLADEEDDKSVEDDYCIRYQNVKLIDKKINKILSQNEEITPDQADIMLRLASLRQYYTGVNNDF